jgi:hypothetical protein
MDSEPGWASKKVRKSSARADQSFVHSFLEVAGIPILHCELNPTSLAWLTPPRCGFVKLTAPAYDSENCASFEICSSCGTEFGHDDVSKSQAELRRTWIASQSESPAADWNVIAQLRAAGFGTVNEWNRLISTNKRRWVLG